MRPGALPFALAARIASLLGLVSLFSAACNGDLGLGVGTDDASGGGGAAATSSTTSVAAATSAG
ncbi:hypothetical protein, partial [Sorangium cellulosum]|uniref:hypothetical protein n=1 Tax=Sorangium cellulosum TaxID=56 RepID=UPI0012DB53C1